MYLPVLQHPLTVFGSGLRVLCSRATSYYTPDSEVGGEWCSLGKGAGPVGFFERVMKRCNSPKGQYAGAQTFAPLRWASCGAVCTALPRRYSCALVHAPTAHTCWRTLSSLHNVYSRLRCERSSCCNDMPDSSPPQRSPRTPGSSIRVVEGWCCSLEVGSGWAHT